MFLIKMGLRMILLMAGFVFYFFVSCLFCLFLFYCFFSIFIYHIKPKPTKQQVKDIDNIHLQEKAIHPLPSSFLGSFLFTPSTSTIDYSTLWSPTRKALYIQRLERDAPPRLLRTHLLRNVLTIFRISKYIVGVMGNSGDLFLFNDRTFEELCRFDLREVGESGECKELGVLAAVYIESLKEIWVCHVDNKIVVWKMSESFSLAEKESELRERWARVGERRMFQVLRVGEVDCDLNLQCICAVNIRSGSGISSSISSSSSPSLSSSSPSLSSSSSSSLSSLSSSSLSPPVVVRVWCGGAGDANVFDAESRELLTSVRCWVKIEGFLVI